MTDREKRVIAAALVVAKRMPRKFTRTSPYTGKKRKPSQYTPKCVKDLVDVVESGLTDA